ncbi:MULTISPECIES: TrbC/VirB2 family protein [Acinetobacter]|jgi:type IV secretion system protein VirB2|uniref:TrbC/VirB2 family protein n=1 Tax=Acinetobacter schindleri TaxID=108981 RepID=A0AAE7BY60_9GAMM|nr:TrbC/VirB2 family protein [Acinetobacter schindleri]QIC68832.1 TrbC/VirB2 family protein [Acinetobacter schindleri]
MKANQTQITTTKTTGIKASVLMLFMTLISSPAFAQISKVNTVMSNVQAVLAGVSITIFTIVIMWAGIKMAWQQAKWADISNIVIGGILVGGAAGIAAWLIN